MCKDIYDKNSFIKIPADYFLAIADFIINGCLAHREELREIFFNWERDRLDYLVDFFKTFDETKFSC